MSQNPINPKCTDEWKKFPVNPTKSSSDIPLLISRTRITVNSGSSGSGEGRPSINIITQDPRKSVLKKKRFNRHTFLWELQKLLRLENSLGAFPLVSFFLFFLGIRERDVRWVGVTTWFGETCSHFTYIKAYNKLSIIFSDMSKNERVQQHYYERQRHLRNIRLK